MNQIRHKNTILRALPSPVFSTHLHSTSRRKKTATTTQAVGNPKWARSSRTAALRLTTTSDLLLQRLQNNLNLPSPDQQQQNQQQITTSITPSSSPPLSMEAITLISLATAVAFICSLDRSAMSVAILPMSETFQWDDTIKGSISAAFFGGYMITNILGGYLATRFSAKHTLAVGVAIWSIFTLSTPIAALSSSAAATLGDSPDITALLAARGAMGLGEGVAYPVIQQMIRAWVPASSRSRALSFIYSGHQIGTIGSYVAAPVIISQWGWPVVFYAFGSLGFVWLMAWLPGVSDGTPESMMIERSGSGGYSERKSLASRMTAVMEKVTASSTCTTSDEQQQAAAAMTTTAISTPSIKFTDIPWAEFAQSKAFWAIVAAQVSVGVGNCLSFSWLPTYYSQQFGVDVTTSSAYTIIPFVVTAMATNASGWIADGLVNNGVICKSSTRKLMQGVASIGPAVCLMKLAADGGSQHLNVNDAVVAITAWLALCGFSAAGYGSNHADISKKWAGVIFGLSNGLASIAGSASIYATGRVLNATHDWGLIFEGAAACYLLGAGVYMVWASSEEQFDK